MATTDERPCIIFAEPYAELYGAQRCMLELYGAWKRQERFRLHFVYFTSGEVSDAVRDLGIESTRIEAGPLLGSYNKRLLNLRWWENVTVAGEIWRYSRKLSDFLVAQGASLFHCNSDRSTLMSILATRRVGCPLVTHIRRDRSFGWIDRVIHRGSDDIVWSSTRIRDEFAQRIGITHPKGHVIYDGRTLLDRDEPDTSREVRSEFGLPASARIALVVASYDPRKDHETLVAAARLACAQEENLFFLLAGNDFTPNEQRFRKIKNLVESGGLLQRVLFLGYRSDVGRLLRSADVLVNPAREEALGGALIEAIGYGVPCVATDTGGTSEIVPHGKCGYLVPRQDPEAMAGRLIELLRDDEALTTFRRNARNHFDRGFTVPRCADETGALFEDIIARCNRTN